MLETFRFFRNISAPFIEWRSEKENEKDLVNSGELSGPAVQAS